MLGGHVFGINPMKELLVFPGGRGMTNPMKDVTGISNAQNIALGTTLDGTNLSRRECLVYVK